jgi:hypothetical protein
VVRFLARKFREDLRAAEKIFVRKSATASFEEIAALHAALRRQGDATLLWVTLANGDRRAGEAEVCQPGLLKGYIDRFSAYEDATGSSFAWFDVCRAAHALYRGECVPERHRGGVTNRQYRISALAELESGVVTGAIPAEQRSAGFAVLQDAVVHGDYGIVTLGDVAIAETLPKGALQPGQGTIVISDPPVAPVVAAGFHLFAGVGEEEEARVHAVTRRLQGGGYDEFARQTTDRVSPILFFPDMEGFSVLNALRELAPRHVPRLAIPKSHAVRVEQLGLPWSLVD